MTALDTARAWPFASPCAFCNRIAVAALKADAPLSAVALCSLVPDTLADAPDVATAAPVATRTTSPCAVAVLPVKAAAIFVRLADALGVAIDEGVAEPTLTGTPVACVVAVDVLDAVPSTVVLPE